MSERMRDGFRGTGPGPITPDGCAVERWLRLPVGREPDIIEAAVPPGASLLELGCGVGRVTHPLLARGFAVTAVDESPEMLAHVRGARTVCSPVETLELGEERFDVVLLASFLVNNGDPAVRRGMLRTCRRYVADGGCVLIEREGDDWHVRVPREARSADGGLVRVATAEPVGPDTSAIRVEYEFPDAVWTQTFVSYRYRGDAFERALAEAGLAVDATLTEDLTWVRARPV
ncbi:class I SAM-dependent methyltransferase [Streptomyces litchfieldiae]|uniref:Class I SAM-dependent methyltransferase n=1 Tax=Streptomyces litchfieldiae TaxID=3075543 RepID=A0ABU2MQF2_9ACTN|nr:class I SAM-dependent methyltransferase [Streptomyces sp. DSM 44938]MDT0343740.1 class I SAM-dependent methyltransferase [Streptomyces sp. DSM 44938]